MTNRDFAYWLQGYFELFPTGGADNTIDNAQEHCIRRHISLVRVTEKEPNDLIEYIQAALDIGNELEVPGTRAAMTKVIRARLAQHFEHVIDKQHPDQKKAQVAHNPDPRTTKIMC